MATEQSQLRPGSVSNDSKTIWSNSMQQSMSNYALFAIMMFIYSIMPIYRLYQLTSLGYIK